MNEKETRASRGASVQVRRAVALFLAFALAFLAFDATLLKPAYAEQGPQVEQAEQADSADSGDAPDDAVEADAGQGTAGESQERTPDEEVGEADQEAQGGNSRAGPDEDATGTATEGDELSVTGAQDSSTGQIANGAGQETGQPDGNLESEEAQATGEASSSESDAATDAQALEGGEEPQLLDGNSRAVVEASCVVTFYSNAAGQNPSVLKRILVQAPQGSSETVDLDAVKAEPPTADQAFSGWNYQGVVANGTIEVNPQNGDVDLHPAFATGHWIRFAGDAGNGQATNVESIFVPAQGDAPSNLSVSARTGYAFAGWFEGSFDGTEVSYGAQVADESGLVVDSNLKQKLLSSDVTLYAQWTGLPTQYRVILWHEDPDDASYSYEGVVVVGDEDGERAVSGEMTDVTSLPTVPGFTMADIEHRPIAGDGSTVINAYYNRNYYEVLFHQQRSDASDVFPELTIRAKYGADIHNRWPQADDPLGRYTTSWYTLTDPDSNVFVTGIGTMPLDGARYYPKLDKGILCNTVYRVQALDNTDEFSDYVSVPFTTQQSPSTTPDDYMPIKGFMVNAASDDDAASIRANPVGDKLAVHDGEFLQSARVSARYELADKVADGSGTLRHTLYFYYLRCQYGIAFEENGGEPVPDAGGIYYEASLSNSAPEAYVEGQTQKRTPNGMTYTFAGWYDNELLTGEKFDFAKAVMPAGNMVLYAKWTPAKYLVQVDPDGGTFNGSRQSTFFWIEQGEPVGDIGVERNYVADEDGGFVYVYEPYGASGADESGVAAYVLAGEGDTGQRYRYQEGFYSLYGWYLTGASAAAGQPYDLNAPVVSDTSIIARWRSAGVFDIAYNPVFEDGGVTVSGSIDTWHDDGYADLAPTYVMNTPEQVDASNGDGYRFVGWRVMSSFEDDAVALDEKLYREGDGFVVDSQLARDNTIHLQAVYERVPEPETPVVPVQPTDPEAPAEPQNPAAPSTGNGSDADVEVVVESADEPEDPQALSGEAVTAQGDSQDGAAASRAASLPHTGDMIKALPVLISAISLSALAVALVARAMKKKQNRDVEV